MVNRGSNAVINNNIVQNTGGNGVVVDELAFAVLTNNTIQNNPGAGVFVSENSTARIGFNSDSETTASPNTIRTTDYGKSLSATVRARGSSATRSRTTQTREYKFCATLTLTLPATRSTAMAETAS